MNNRRVVFFLGILFVLTGVFYVAVEILNRHLPLPVLISETHEVQPFELVNQYGDTVSSETFSDKIWVVNYFFTSCPEICPRMTTNIKKVFDAYETDTTIQFLSLSVNPEGDSISALKMFAERYGIDNHRWYFLTGEKKTLYRLARKSFMVSATEGTGENDDFIHSESAVLIDPAGINSASLFGLKI